MNWSSSVLSTVSSDTEPTIVITFDTGKYIFNVGENTHRAFLQSRSNFKRVKGIFLTKADTQRASGLAGILMTFADATIPRLDIVGPPGTKHLLASMRWYTYRRTLGAIATEAPFSFTPSASPDPVFSDENMTVYSVPVYSSSYSSGISESASSSSLKRKRDASPDVPSKKVASTISALPFSSDNSLEDISISTETETSDSYPTSLRGEHAQEWRDLMIDTMLSASKKERERRAKEKASGNPAGEQRRKKKEKKIASPPPVVDSSNLDEFRRHLPPGFHKQLPKFSYQDGNPAEDRALTYVIVGPRIRGKFDAAKAKELQVPNGPCRLDLTRGQAITFTVMENGTEVTRTVRPEEVVGPSEVPSVVIIADVPTPGHIPSLVSSFSGSPFYSKFRSNRPEDLQDHVVRVIYHICGEGVLEDERYLDFMRGFGPQVHHVVASKEYCSNPVTFTSAAFHQLRLSKLDPDIFVIPKYSLTPKKDIKAIPNLPPSVTPMEANIIASMRPPAPPSKEEFAIELDRFHSADAEGLELPSSTEVCFNKAKAEVAAFVASGGRPEMPGGSVRIITLGTGSAVPSKYRNVSATVISIPGYGNILLDCGEGTWGNLVRHFGEDESSPTNVWQFLRDLKCIFISHTHGDHHMGTAKLLAQRKKLNPSPTQPLYLVTLRTVHVCLRELSDLQDLGLFDPVDNGVITVLSPALHWRNPSSYPSFGMWQIGGTEPWLNIEESRKHYKAMCRALGLQSFRTVDVRHKTRCYGAVIKHNDGWSVVFSGDTVPSDNLVYAGQGATVLVHEATMSDDQEDLAQKKAHSTLGQALTIGRRMNAKNTLLTHFSARYPKVPTWQEKSVEIAGEVPGGDTLPVVAQAPLVPVGDDEKQIVAVAFDHADMTVDSLWKMNFYLSALEQSYQDTVTEDADEGGEGGEGVEMEVNVA
ncbi:hypothetical protein D9758_007983 [Tetrapyrgos nigripes]|uniref:ribonuclease Z n=1 Tax=Tetrapyrgos nigripes TaxID=182062 RepID=A0A8H5FW86_9AGAR|nr:hypothetical protein D9758_007983 [Tetrapyrgos nigripes]